MKNFTKTIVIGYDVKIAKEKHSDQREGTWEEEIYLCPTCDFNLTEMLQNNLDSTNYCPNCGKKLIQ